MTRFLFILLSLYSLNVNAGPLDRLEKLVMPGKLSVAHAKYENDCTKCHKRFEKIAQTDRCMACHKNITKDVKNKVGLHGNITDIKKRSCTSCHREHNGREADIIPLDIDTFDHKRTNFALRGQHARLNCKECHGNKKKFRKTPAACFACHKAVDAHHGKLGKKCNDCHVETMWGEAYFNHNKTKFKLKAMHKNVRCIECHPNEKYKNMPKGCITCHKLDDVHQKNHGKKCENCHSESMWSKISFVHNKDTKYILKGRHLNVSCQSCHKGNVFKKLKKNCVNCHEKDDAHNKLFGKKCESCHVTKAWGGTIFDHKTDTKFALKGKHRKVDCIMCHRGDVKDKLKKLCVNCHIQDDEHNGQQGDDCHRCHNEKGWHDSVFFDHDLTDFPLLGSHLITPCQECHFTATFKNTATKCRLCHIKDDARIHKQRLGLNCELCHNSNNWNKWVFDHEKQANYKLSGSHENLNCHACHQKIITRKIELDKVCGGCHKDDDRHLGALGDKCEQCHVTESFSKIILQ